MKLNLQMPAVLLEEEVSRLRQVTGSALVVDSATLPPDLNVNSVSLPIQPVVQQEEVVEVVGMRVRTGRVIVDSQTSPAEARVNHATRRRALQLLSTELECLT